MGPETLAQVMRHMDTGNVSPRVLVGLDFPDDAGIFRLDEERALVQSVDFFTPVVDDPADFGAIAASNALSDLYAMGAEPLTALNLVAFPEEQLPLWVLDEILRGSASVLEEAGVALLGGHSIDDREPKFGLSVTGMVHPDRIIRTGGARPGDILVLTKPIGAGVITTALKRDMADQEVVRTAVSSMKETNAEAAEAAREITVSAATDVTGFGLLGHAAEMADASDCTLDIYAEAVPLLPGARELASRDVFPGGSRANLNYLISRGAVEFGDGVEEYIRLLLADAVTSGGLLLSIPKTRGDALLEAMKLRGVQGYPIGVVGNRRGDTAIRVFQCSG